MSLFGSTVKCDPLHPEMECEPVFSLSRLHNIVPELSTTKIRVSHDIKGFECIVKRFLVLKASLRATLFSHLFSE